MLDGTDLSGKQSPYWQKVVDELHPSTQVSTEGQCQAAYLKISSSLEVLIQKLIPNSSERIQILHHAYTYSRKQTAILVSDPKGKLMRGLPLKTSYCLLTVMNWNSLVRMD